MEVRHLDDNHENHAEGNLACVCPFCHLRDHLGPTGFAGAGIIIGSTTLTQGQVNALAISIWYIQSRIEKVQDIRALPGQIDEESSEAWAQRLLNTATALWNDLTSKSIRWTGAYSPLASEPDMLGGVLKELSVTDPKTYADRGESLAGLHVLPMKEAFEKQCADWFAEFDRSRPISSWLKGMESLMARLESNPDDFYLDVRKNLKAAARTSPDSLARPIGPAAPAASDGGDASADTPPPTRPAGIGSRYAR
jgi:hypothetical protein